MTDRVKPQHNGLLMAFALTGWYLLCLPQATRGRPT